MARTLTIKAPQSPPCTKYLSKPSLCINFIKMRAVSTAVKPGITHYVIKISTDRLYSIKVYHCTRYETSMTLKHVNILSFLCNLDSLSKLCDLCILKMKRNDKITNIAETVRIIIKYSTQIKYPTYILYWSDRF